MNLTEYNVIADLGLTDHESVNLDDFAEYHAVLAASPANGHLELIVTVPGDGMRQAVSTALSVIQERLGFEPFVVRAMSTAAFDQGFDVLDSTSTITVREAADLMGVTPAAVRQRLASGSLAGYREGRDWRVNARVAVLCAPSGEQVARLRVPAGQPVVHEGTRYAPTGNGSSVGADATAYSYLPV